MREPVMSLSNGLRRGLEWIFTDLNRCAIRVTQALLNPRAVPLKAAV